MNQNQKYLWFIMCVITSMIIISQDNKFYCSSKNLYLLINTRVFVQRLNKANVHSQNGVNIDQNFT